MTQIFTDAVTEKAWSSVETAQAAVDAAEQAVVDAGNALYVANRELAAAQAQLAQETGVWRAHTQRRDKVKGNGRDKA
jgi:hypothetical protein